MSLNMSQIKGSEMSAEEPHRMTSGLKIRLIKIS